MTDGMQQVKALVQAGRFEEARQVLASIEHPKRDEWLKRLDEMAEKQQSKAVLPKESLKQAVPPQMPLSKKRLPLLPEEERILLPRGRPEHPQVLVKSPINDEGSPAMYHLLGAKSGRILMNYLKMDNYFMFGVSVFILFCFLLLSMVGASILGQANLGKEVHPIALVFGFFLLLPIPLSPYFLAWIQEEHYSRWEKRYRETLDEFYKMKGME